MKNITACFVLMLFWASSSFSQPERADIIDKKIKSYTKTTFANADTAKKEVYKFVFSKAGDDSIQYAGDQVAFTFIAERDNKGRVSKLTRFDSRGNEDEWHMYTYKRSGSYSIEVVAHGAGTISLATYDKNNWLMEEEIESSYSMIYERTALGKPQKIYLKKKGKSSELIAIFYFDQNGLATKGEATKEGSTVYFRYNDKRLPVELKTVIEEKKVMKATETTLLEYEYYEDEN